MTCPPLPTGSEHDFDFLAGDWIVANRRLRERHVGADQWDEFPAQMRGWSLLGGIVSVDEIEFPTLGFAGCTFRHFDRARRRWSIYWVNSRDGEMLSPVRGGFDGPNGLFFGEDVDAGRPIQVRFLWTRLDADHARWEQAFSLDGQRWETNWVMESARRVPA